MNNNSTKQRVSNRSIWLMLLMLFMVVGSTFAQTLNIEKVSVSGCYYSGGSSKCVVTVQVGWTGLNPGNNIAVTIGSTTKIIQAESTPSITKLVTPQVVAFEIPSNGAAGTISATQSTLGLNASGNYTSRNPCAPLQCNAGELGGQAFHDYNNDGIHQASETQGQSGITVKAIDKNGVVYTTTTDAEGKWKLSIPTTSYCVRVEYSNIPSNVRSSSTVTGNTTTQFYNAPTCNADMGVLDIADYAQNNPLVYNPIWYNGDPQDASLNNRFGISVFNYNDNYPAGNVPGGVTSDLGPAVAPYSQIGPTWGLAWNKFTKKLYAGAVLRRHAGLGPQGLAGLYTYDQVSNTVSGIDLTTLGLNFGSIGSNASREIGSIPNPSWDIEAFDKIGKVGIGDIDINEDGTELYVVNLFTKQIHVLNLPALTLNRTINIPNPGCNGGGFRPWGIKYYKGKLYSGVVCDALSSQNKSSMFATVYEIDPTSGTGTSIFDFPLTYPKGTSQGLSGWYPWSDNYNQQLTAAGSTYFTYPQPILSDIDFDIDGSMAINFIDRGGLQWGWSNYRPDPTKTNNAADIVYFGSGDMLKAYKANGVFSLENGGVSGPYTGSSTNNNEGPGFGEFYYDGGAHSELFTGGIAIKPGSGEVAVGAMDPGTAVCSGGVRFLSNTNGGMTRAVNTYGNGCATLVTATFGKSNGLGDVEFALDVPNFSQIGNRVWQDTDGDGIQDPCEPGIQGITMKLYNAAGTLVGTTTTDASGNYYFGNGVNGINLTPGADYYVVAGSGQYNATNGLVDGSGNKYGELTLSLTGEGTNPTNNDNNGTIAPNAGVNAGFAGLPYARVTAPATNTVDHTIDFGFSLGSLGNYVWQDTNGDGLQNEPAGNGINGVSVELYKETTPGNYTLVNTTTTANDGSGNPGYYNFVIPTSGNYKVKFPTTNGIYPLTIQTTTAATDGNSDADNATGFSPVVVMNVLGSGVAKNNPTIDAGYGPLGSLGNYVWYDDNNDGLQNEPSANGVNGVTVELYKETAPGTGVYNLFTSTVTTNDGSGNPGYYNFPNLNNANYKVKFPLNIGNYPISNPNNQAAQVDGNNDANRTTGFSGVVPINVTLGGLNKDNPTIDAGYRRNIGSLGNYVWADDNGDGLQNEPASNGINGVKVYLLDGGGNKIDSTVTANDGSGNPGYYNFPDLLSGNYQVQFPTTTGGFPLTTQTPTAKTDGNSDANTSTGKSPVVVINTASGNPLDVNNPTIDAGYLPIGSIGNYVWYDQNKDGVQNEPAINGINGVKVYLYKETAPGVYTKVDSTLTADSAGIPTKPGYYNFPNLTKNNYKVQFPTNWGNYFSTPIVNQAAQVDGNSDASVTTGFSGIVPLNPVAGGLNKDNPTIDAGYYCDCSGFMASIVMNKTYDCFVSNSFTFSANINRNGGSYSYFWDFGDGTTSTLANPTHSYTAAGEYDVKLTVTDNGFCGCRYEASARQVYVGPQPKVNYDWQYNGNCLTYDFNSNSTVSMGWITGFYWDFGNGTTSTQSNPLATFAAPGTYNVKLVVTTNYGCKDSIIFPVNIINKCTTTGNSTGSTNNPCPSIGAITGNTTLCVAGTSNLADTTAGGTWASSNTAVATISNAGVVTALSAGSTTITYTVVRPCGTVVSSVTVNVTANSAQPIVVSVDSVCIGSTIYLSNANGGGIYTASNANATISGSGVTGVTAGNVTVTYTVVTPCGTFTSTKLIKVVNCPAPVTCNASWWSQPATSNCDSTLRFDVSTPSAGATYNWTFGDGTTGTGNPAAHKYPASGSFTVKLVVTNGTCKDSVSYNVYVNSCSVTPGSGGGVESKSLGDVIAVRLYGNAINSVAEMNGYSNATKFVTSGFIVNGTNDLKLSDLVPTTVANTDAAFVTTPSDLVNFTNAVEVLAVDYAKGNSTKAVAFGTKTLGDVYSHTKPICDRLKGAELQEVKNITVNGFNLMAYKVRQRTGETEYAINLSAGTAANRNTISLQSNWFTDSYQQDEKLYNFQLWAVSYEMVTAMATDIISKLQANGAVNTVTNADVPKAYISKGSRKGTDLTVTVNNNTAATSGYFELHEKANENAATTTRQVAFTVTANAATNVTIPVRDNYEGDVYVYLNNKLTDLVYLADGTWNLDYNKQTTSISKFDVINETPNNLTPNSSELRLFRNVNVTGTTKDYITIYKTMMGGGLEQNVTAYNGLLFNANAKGAGKVQVTLVKKSITNWKEQYTYTMDLDGDKEYCINFNQFKSTKFAQAINANDIVAVNFSFSTSRGTTTNMNINLSKARFSNIATATTEIANALKITPNPTTGRFVASFNSTVKEDVIINVIEIASGKVVKVKTHPATKGTNTVSIDLGNVNASGLYIVNIAGDSQSFKPAKLMISGK